MPLNNFLAKQRAELKKRLDELKPFHDEYLTLLEAQKALSEVTPVTRGGRRRGRPPARRGPGRPATKRGPGRPAAKRGPGRPATKRGPGRPRASDGTRAEQALAIVAQNPGITVPGIAKKVNIRQNYLYRVMADLHKKGSVKRRNRGYHPA